LFVYKKLNTYWEKTHDDELGNLLSEFNPCLFEPESEKNKVYTADPAAWYDWIEAIQKLMPHNECAEQALINAKKAHGDLCDWLDVGNKLFKSNQITQAELVKETRARGNKSGEAWDDWVEAVRKQLPDGRITFEQAKAAIVLLMQEYNKQGFELNEIIDNIDDVFKN